MTKKKKTSRRSRTKHAALKPELNLRSRYELIDYDYVSKLSEDDKDWLNAFTEEYINANMNHKGKKLHTSKKLKKDCYDRNNARNRCIWTRSKASGDYEYLEALSAKDKKKRAKEEFLIEESKKLEKTNTDTGEDSE